MGTCLTPRNCFSPSVLPCQIRPFWVNRSSVVVEICQNNKLNCRWQISRCFVQMQWHGWSPKTCPSPYVFPCRIWSFCAKGCGHKYRTPKIGDRWTPLSRDGMHGWPRDTRPSTRVTTSDLAFLRQTLYAGK